MAIVSFSIIVENILTVIQHFNKIQVQRSKLGSPYTDATFVTAPTSSAPSVTGSHSAPVAISGLTFKLKINQGDEQTITFVGANPLNITTIVNRFNALVTSATASNYLNRLKITGNFAGSSGILEITGGSALTALGFTSGTKVSGIDTDISMIQSNSTYAYVDLNGDSSYYYRTRFFNPTTQVYSDFSDWAQDSSSSEIGDLCTTTYSEEEIIGINCLLGALKARLKNNLEIEALDAYGNTTYESCPVFTDEELVWFLNCSLSEFNQTPHFTDFTFDMEVIYKRFSYIIVEGAFILATAAQMLIEAGREFTISDNGITLNPPPLSSILNNELSVFVTRHTEMLKFIKNSIKPYPSGFGNFRALAISPNYARLRHLRQRRII